MKALPLFAAIIILFSACSKKSSEPEPAPEDPNSVTIDGTKYPIVRLGTQTWTAVNYNGSGGANYNDSPVNDPQNGKLYTYKEAVAVKLPAGWRLPTKEDFHTLASLYAFDLKALLATTSWNEKMGNNTSGFNALATGYKTLGRYGLSGSETAFFTTTYNESPPYQVCQLIVSYDHSIGAPTSNPLQEENDRVALRFIKSN